MNERKTCKQILASDEKVLKVNLNNVFRITKSCLSSTQKLQSHEFLWPLVCLQEMSVCAGKTVLVDLKTQRVWPDFTVS